MEAFAHLAPLTQLTELALDGWPHWLSLAIDPTTDDVLTILPMPSMRVLSLKQCLLLGDAELVGATFCRTYSAILPNLRDLYMVYWRTKTDIEQHLGSFGKLRKHRIYNY